MQKEWADRRRASENVTETGRHNALERWRKTQIAKAARVRRQQDAELLNTYKGKLAAFDHAISNGAIELSEWIETDWRPNLPAGHPGRLGH
jgi:tRNA G37 N-methylase TrmD